MVGKGTSLLRAKGDGKGLAVGKGCKVMVGGREGRLLGVAIGMPLVTQEVMRQIIDKRSQGGPRFIANISIGCSWIAPIIAGMPVDFRPLGDPPGSGFTDDLPLRHIGGHRCRREVAGVDGIDIRN